MREDFLHYLWRYQNFDFSQLQTISNESLQIIHPGSYLENAGPDFFNALIIIDNQKWAGNIEIHVKSSDWYLHNHQRDIAYDNVILHVVWEHDAPVYNLSNKEIPVLEIQKFVSNHLIVSYQNLTLAKSWIYCENSIQSVDAFVLTNWMERLFIERLEQKSEEIFRLLARCKNDWESVLFYLLAKNFGLNHNGVVFQDNVLQIPFSIIRKEAFNQTKIEALLMGCNGLLNPSYEDAYAKKLLSIFEYQVEKYQIRSLKIIQPQFFKLRPDNFPTIRLSQLAALYNKNSQLFEDVIHFHNLPFLYSLFDIKVDDYWENHYHFDMPCKTKKRSLSKSFIQLLAINTILPLRFAYMKALGETHDYEIFSSCESIPAEENSITQKFKSINVPVKNALDSQALLYLKKNYCEKIRCLDCNIGISILKSSNVSN